MHTGTDFIRAWDVLSSVVPGLPISLCTPQQDPLGLLSITVGKAKAQDHEHHV